jgi:hypothetical protein
MPERDLLQEAKDMQQRYKNVFGTAEGRIVLGDILTLGHFGKTLNADDPVRLGEYSLAVIIAEHAGAFNGLYKDFGMIQKGE